MRNTHFTLVEKSGRKRPLGRPRYRGEYHITIECRGTGWKDMEWIHLAHENKVMKLRAP